MEYVAHNYEYEVNFDRENEEFEFRPLGIEGDVWRVKGENVAKPIANRTRTYLFRDVWSFWSKYLLGAPFMTRQGHSYEGKQ